MNVPTEASRNRIPNLESYQDQNQLPTVSESSFDSIAFLAQSALTFVLRVPAASFTSVPRSCHSKTPQNFRFVFFFFFPSHLRLFHFIGLAEGVHLGCYWHVYVLNEF